MRCVTQSERIGRIGNSFTDRNFDLGFFDWENDPARSATAIVKCKLLIGLRSFAEFV